MLIGVDFDNTIVCYDALFHKVAREKNHIPASVPVNKSEVRNYLRRAGKEDIWTEMQGCVYGARMSEAAPFPGVKEFFKFCKEAGIPIRIISHKTRHPFLGEKYDLHQAATRWLEEQGFFDDEGIALSREHVFFELTKEDKLQRIGLCHCAYFIDDLPEFLSETGFPEGVHRVLFDPNHLYPSEPWTKLHSWASARDLIGPPPSIEKPVLAQGLKPFLLAHGVREGFDIKPLSGGGNNRVYRVQNGDEQRVLKVYFNNPADPRDRFGTEKAFYSYLWALGIRRTPQPLGWDADNRFALFEAVEGRKLSAGELALNHVNQALEFVAELNRAKSHPSAERIPPASEACFSMAGHLDCVGRRVDRLRRLETLSDIDRQAASFVQAELVPLWSQVCDAIVACAPEQMGRELPEAERCLSPSDFGFHNALLPGDGKLRFFDFEYAGWDDPAKLVCDFFCQPQIPVSMDHWDYFLKPLAQALHLGKTFQERAAMLLPAYQVKWCCIMLNEFLRSEQARREFAQGSAGATALKSSQLEKAKAWLKQVRLLPAIKNKP